MVIKLILKIFWRFKKIGAEHIPKSGGVIIASNHVAYVDPPFLGAVTPRELFYLAKAELFSNALFGWLLDKCNAIPIARGAFDRRAIFRAVELLREGKALLLFPEGTRGRDGKFLEPKLGVGKIALEAGVPIVPTYIHNSGNLFSSFLKRKRLIIGFDSPIRKSWLDKFPKDRKGYRSIGQEIMKRIGRIKEKIEKSDF
ncbi:MAG: 1-acyl-sn-glycerol-3-phosphate acyltransferase [candidate division Zixibacteria bacterium]|nr:1-acyl-sn-glycerol-3-phosphate acyltransferase [candidate division Zixibacteria bacterium]